MQQFRATPQDCLRAWDKIEAIELTNPDNANATEPNWVRLEFALEDAYQLCLSYDAIACLPGKVLIRKNLRRLMTAIARYNLDTLKRREDVTRDYEQVMELLHSSNSSEICSASVPDEVVLELGLIPISPTQVHPGYRVWTRENLSNFTNRRGYRPW